MKTVTAYLKPDNLSASPCASGTPAASALVVRRRQPMPFSTQDITRGATDLDNTVVKARLQREQDIGAGHTLVTVRMTPVVLNGSGLSLDYFTDYAAMSGAVAGGTVTEINWQAMDGEPYPGVPPDFGARFSGSLMSDVTGTHELEIVHDDGVRVWVNDILLVDAWYPHASWDPNAYTSFHLDAGVKYAIRIDFFDSMQAAWLIVRWKKPGDLSYSLLKTPYIYID